MKFTIAALPGDGIGPEIMESGLSLLETIGKKFRHEFNVTSYPFGGAGIDETGDPIPPQTIKGCQEADAILLAAIGGPKWENAEKTPEDGLLQLRKMLGLFSNIRPIAVSDSIAHLSPLKTERVKGTDFVVVRELTGGLYFGQPKMWNDEEATDTLYYKKSEIDQIVRQAFDIAMTRNKKVTSVDKANVLASSKLWRKTVNEIATEYPEVTVEHLYVDAASMKIIQNPTAFDVIVTENMFGDILSDEASVITGSLGMLPSGSHSKKGPSLYEPIHGSAPDIAGKNIANPMSMILSVVMMLRQSLHLYEEADDLEKAAKAAMDAGFLTADLGGDTKTTEFTAAVQANLVK